MFNNFIEISDLDHFIKEVVNAPSLNVVLFVSKKTDVAMNLLSQLDLEVEPCAKTNFYYVLSDDHPEIIWRHRVSILPTLMLFRNNQKLYEKITTFPAESIYDILCQFQQ